MENNGKIIKFSSKKWEKRSVVVVESVCVLTNEEIWSVTDFDDYTATNSIVKKEKRDRWAIGRNCSKDLDSPRGRTVLRLRVLRLVHARPKVLATIRQR